MISPSSRRANQSLLAERASASFLRRLASSVQSSDQACSMAMLPGLLGQLGQTLDQRLVDRAVRRPIAVLLLGSERGGRLLAALEHPRSRSRQERDGAPLTSRLAEGFWCVDLGGVGLDPGADPDDQDGDVVEAAAEVGQVDEVAAGVVGVEVPGEGAELVVVDRPGEAVGAEQVRRRRARRPAGPRCRPRRSARARGCG